MDVWCFVNKEQWTSDVSPTLTCSPFPSRISESVKSALGSISRSLVSMWSYEIRQSLVTIFCFSLLLTLFNVDLHCWRLRMKLSTSPCSSSIASMMHLRSGQAKQVLQMEIRLFSNRLDFRIQWTHFNDVWMVSSTRSIASLTWSRRRWIRIKI